MIHKIKSQLVKNFLLIIIITIIMIIILVHPNENLYRNIYSSRIFFIKDILFNNYF